MTTPTQTMSDELLPCPFCNAPAHEDVRYINCSNDKCLVRPVAKYYDDIKIARKHWNTRPAAASLLGALTENEAVAAMIDSTSYLADLLSRAGHKAAMRKAYRSLPTNNAKE